LSGPSRVDCRRPSNGWPRTASAERRRGSIRRSSWAEPRCSIRREPRQGGPHDQHRRQATDGVRTVRSLRHRHRLRASSRAQVQHQQPAPAQQTWEPAHPSMINCPKSGVARSPAHAIRRSRALVRRRSSMQMDRSGHQ
jgi:hypothetical protein